MKKFLFPVLALVANFRTKLQHGFSRLCENVSKYLIPRRKKDGNILKMEGSPLGLDDKPHELKLGSSFSTKDQTFHSIRYDFKPASMDTNQVAAVQVGKGNEVTVSVPHIEGASSSHTDFKGNKRPSQKDCVLIIDHETGEIKLEKLSYMVQLKKTRSVPAAYRGQQLNRPSTPIEQPIKTKDVKTSPGKTKIASKPTAMAAHARPSPVYSRPSPSSQESPVPTPETKRVEAASVGIMTDSSGSDSGSSSGSDSESESEKPPAKVVKHNPVANVNSSDNSHSKHFMSTLCEDLQLSESGSDSD
ncbi:ELL-associated factor 1-like isoform X2 [Lineus longissimus]|uniref:ELL-associated factor 1-like isoform X2 n=1 Tax=Lineus longissimus TaxID=88925 RepID=UPI002B4E6437